MPISNITAFIFTVRLRRILPRALAVAFVALAGCSIATFTYDLAPRIALHYVDDYLHLSGEQEDRALELFHARHALHARDELPRYYRFLMETRAAADDAITADEVSAIFDGVESLAKLGIERTIPAAAAILASLDADQLDILEERLADNAEEYREELDDDHAGRRLGETLKDIEEWTGSITDEQRRMVTRELRAMAETAPMWLEWRIERNERLVALLRAAPGESEIEDFLAGYWLRRDALPDALRAGTDENRSRYRAMIVSLHASLDDGQRRHVDEKLMEYIDAVVDMMPDEVRVAALPAANEAESRP